MEAVLAALLVFALRLSDVTLGTLRIVFVVRGRRGLAGLFGFFESLIWVTAAGLVLSDLDDPVRMVGYAAGFACGTMLGSTVEGWLAMGTVLVRIVAPVDSPQALPHLHAAGYPATVVNGEGRDGEVRVVFSIVPRRRAREVLDIVSDVNPDSFVTIEEARMPELLARKAGASLRK